MNNLDSHEKEYQVNHLLFFSINDSEERKEFCKNIFMETWYLIPEDYKGKILTNLDFIIFKNVEDFYHDDTPGCALLNKINFRCFVIFNPFINLIERETKIHILAHELAHVYYNHPFHGFNKGSEEKTYINEIAEAQAYDLTENIWKILPNPDDICKLPKYKQYVLSKRQ